jgi:hypothetical protein
MNRVDGKNDTLGLNDYSCSYMMRIIGEKLGIIKI